MEGIHEENISALEQEEKKRSRLSFPDGDQGGSRCAQTPSGQRPPETHRLRRALLTRWVRARSGKARFSGMVKDDRSFPRQNRLRGRSNFLAVWHGKGSLCRKGRYCEIAWADGATSGNECGGTTRFGLSVAGRVGDAVRRNRIKRIIREYLRNSRNRWPANKMVVIRIKAPVIDESDLIAELEDMLGNLK